MNRNHILFILACIILGFASMLSQIVLFREFLSVFYGNELCLGILLCVWLLWVGLGSKLGNSISRLKNNLLRNLCFWYFLLGAFSILTIIGIRHSRIILNTLPGEIIGFVPMLLFTFFALAPLCLILGLLFVLNSTVWNFASKEKFLVTKVYLWESLGAGAGGLIGSLILIPHLSNFSIQSWLLIALLLFSALLLISSYKKRAIFVSLLLVLGVLAFKIVRLDSFLEEESLKKLWRGQPIVKSVDSIYGNLAVLKVGEQISFYENGLLLSSYPDEYSSEEAVLFAVAEHSEPKNLLLIGGGIGGALAQALKYKELKLDYVELDQKIIELGKSFLPESEIKSLENKRGRIIHQDGRLFVREKVEEGKDKYDLIILNLPDPYNSLLNRFYTQEFFNLVKRLLKSDGIFSFRVTSAENYLNPDQALYISSLYRTLETQFKSVVVLPGANNIFLASDGKNLTDDWTKITESLKLKDIRTTYLNQHFLSNRLSNERIEYLHRKINSFKGEKNFDLRPISYFYNIVLWSTQLKSFEKSVFIFLAGLNPVWYFLIGSLLSFSIAFSILKGRNLISGFSLYAIFLVGFSSINLEICILLVYQIFYGYVYSQVGLFLTLFMLGLFSGALFMGKNKKRGGLKTLTKLQSLQVILIFLLLVLISDTLRFWLSPGSLQWILGGLIFLSGFIGGAEFIYANQLYLERKGKSKVGTGYAIDLFGSALSSILASAILIPLLGIPLSLWLLFLLNFILLSVLYFSFLRTKVTQL